MKEYPGIDYGFRPQSYWLDRDVLQALLRNVKGAERRKMIKSYYKNGNFQELEESFSKISLSDEERFRLASIHPCSWAANTCRITKGMRRKSPE